MRFPAYINFILFMVMMAMLANHASVFADPDTAWHLASGDLIRKLGGLPVTDSWSFTAAGEPWYNLSWLFDLGISTVYSIGGFALIFVITITGFALALAVMTSHCVRRGASPLMIFVTALFVMLGFYSGVLARPNLTSILLTILFYLILHRYRERGNWRVLIALPLLMMLWVNLHGGFLLAFVLIGLYGLEALIQGRRRAFRACLLVFALTLAATLVNPYGFGIFYGAWRSLTGTFDQTYIFEWKPAEVGRNVPVTALLILMLAFGNLSDRRIELVDRMLAGFVFYLSLTSIRHMVVAVFLMMPYLSLRLTAFFADYPRLLPRLSRWDDAIARDMDRRDVKIQAGLMAFGAFLLLCAPFPRDLLRHEPPGFPKDAYPVTEAAYIEAHYPDVRFFNDYNIGGYLDYLWRGRIKVFVDGRASSLFSEEVLKDYATFIDSHGFGGHAEMIAEHYKLGGIILSNETDHAGDWRWNPRWKAVFQGPVATVYVRAGKEAASRP